MAKGESKQKTLRTKINAIKAKLAEMRDYKKLMAKEGVAADRDDKERESKLIIQLLRHEKELAALTGQPPKPVRPEKKKGNGKAEAGKRKEAKAPRRGAGRAR